jgi:starch-binding outer membrane protein, SusD/RagB family
MTRIHRPQTSVTGVRAPRGATLVIAAAVLAVLAGCSDSNVPFFTSPTSVPNSPAGIQDAMTGLFAATRNDLGAFQGIETNSVAGYARDGANFTNTEPRWVTYALGVLVMAPEVSGVWNQEYQNIKQGQAILAAIPDVSPAYTAAQAASLAGIVQTLMAYNYMFIAENHDTLGLAIRPAGITGTTAPPAVCAKDAWEYIVALLDSGETNLVTAGSVTAPNLVLPAGFKGVYQSSGPPGTLGSFASFNRALAAKANVELAYTIARMAAGSAPTPSSPGSPSPTILATALTDLTSSAMYNPSVLAPDPAGQFTEDAYDVAHDFSAQSGDLVNPIQGFIGTLAQLNDFTADVDTLHDLRWKTKFITNPNPVQQQLYNPVATITASIGGKEVTWSYIYDMYSSTSSPIPIVREAQLIIWHGWIELGLGNYSLALADANLLRTVAGGLAPYPLSDASAYETVRNDLMRETRVSTTWESSADRTIEIRNYGMQAVSDTTWEHEDPAVKTGDLHTTVSPIPTGELDGRGGTWSPTCS